MMGTKVLKLHRLEKVFPSTVIHLIFVLKTIIIFALKMFFPVKIFSS